MNFIRTPLTAMLLALATAVATPALAGPITGEIFELDTFVGTGTPSAGPYGSVTLTKSGSNVDVLVKLSSPTVGFVKTGAGDALFFNLGSISTIAVTGLTAGFAFESLTNGNIHSGGAGNWDFGIVCTTACGSGGSSPAPGPLSFTLTNVTLDDFTQNSNGYYFSSDLCIGLVDSKCGVTGNAVSDHDAPVTDVPEPTAIALFGAGLAGLGALRRRRKAKAA